MTLRYNNKKLPMPKSQSKRIRTSSPISRESHREISFTKDDGMLTVDRITGSSSALELMLGGYAIETFFEEIWQKKPWLTKCTKQNHADIVDVVGKESNVEIQHVQGVVDSSSKSNVDALRALISINWDTLADILERSRSIFHTLDDLASITTSTHKFQLNGIDPPLIFQDQSPLQYDLIQELYSSNPLAAYLDGCSVVINHVDFIHDLFASLCVDLQRTFPHVYVNTYLTPPSSCAVSAHADDRDVFVIQLLGSKHWEVYQAPILFPYSDEQVGKGNLPVPQEILTSPPLIEKVLSPGDVLYMPRGFVHKARTLTSVPSFHATIAVATHDWTLARTIPDLIKKTLESIPKYRMALPLWLLREDASKDDGIHDRTFQSELDQTIQYALTDISVNKIRQEMSQKIHVHNSRAESLRLHFQEWWKLSNLDSNSSVQDPSMVVGPKAARYLKWETSIVRSTTPEERSFARDPLGTKTVGLTVREESRDALLSILGYFNTHTKEQVPISNVRSLMSSKTDGTTICDFTLLCFVKCCVELGSLAVV